MGYSSHHKNPILGCSKYILDCRGDGRVELWTVSESSGFTHDHRPEWVELISRSIAPTDVTTKRYPCGGHPLGGPSVLCAWCHKNSCWSRPNMVVKYSGNNLATIVKMIKGELV